VAEEDAFADIDTTCQALYEAGTIQYPEGVSGERCQEVVFDNTAMTGLSPTDRLGLLRSCQYGQTFGEVDGHYEETNSVGWDHVGDYLEVVRELTAFGDPWPMINENFEAVNFETANAPE